MPQLSKDNRRVFHHDSIVVVMGPIGTGKSTFIERATGQGGQAISRKLGHRTEDIQTIRIQHPAGGHPVVFIDTPGFDGPSPSDPEILIMIANFLVETYKEKAKLATIVYLHNISDNRMTGALLENLQIFANFCGQKAMPNVVIATTMWDKVDEEEGNEREDELKRDFWTGMVADGCRTERFENTCDSAWRIIGSVVGKDGPQLSKDNRRVFHHDSIVVVMGPIGTGKSTFIERATCQGGQTVGRGLQPFTKDIRVIRAHHPVGGHPVIFIDTPGFDGPSPSDTEILIMIADFLVETYKEKAKLATIVYLHNISDNRMTGSLLKNLQMFASLCGHKSMPNVVIATTMWDRVSEEEGNEREDELKRDFWTGMVADGCRTERFENTYDSAWRIIGSVIGKDGVSSEIVGNARQIADAHANEAASKWKELEAFMSQLLGIFAPFRRKRSSS